MTMATDIKKWGKLLIMLLSVVLLLSACSSDTTRAISREDATIAANAEGRESCWQGAILVPIYDMIGQTVMKMYNNLSKGALNLMMIGFAVWLALRLLKFVSSVTEDSPAEVWNEILKKAFICLFCGILAASSTMLLVVINNLLFPIYQAFLEFGAKILALSEENVTSVQILGSTVNFEKSKLLCNLSGNATASLDGFPTNIRDMMGCMACSVADRLMLGRQMALVAMSNGGLLPFVIGALVWLTFIVVGCGFIFYLVDSVFRFGMMILLLPILIMAYAFGPTRKWTNIGFVNIMNSAAFMMAFSIIVATTLMAMAVLLQSSPDIFNPPNPEMHMRDFSIVMMCLLLVGFLVFGSMQISQQLTSAIIGGKVDAKFQQNLKAVGQMILGIITGGLGWAAKRTFLNENNKLGRAWKSAGALNNKLKDWAGRKD